MERQLIQYLPYAIREFQEYKGITTGEQPEFELAWDHWQDVLDNQFLETAGDYGLSRWEKMLQLVPKCTDSLKARRDRIRVRLLIDFPYTWRALIKYLTVICGGPNFVLEGDRSGYQIWLALGVEAWDQWEEVRYLLDQMLPCNIYLGGISYMVRRGIVIRQRMDAWTYRVPECGTLRCGMWWTPHTLGWSERRQLTAKGQAETFSVSPELSGTLPVVKTPGYSLRSGLHVSEQADAYPIQPQEAGVIQSGTEWTRRTLGWSEQAGALAESGQADAYNISPELAGTLPNTSKLGYALVCGAVRCGGVIDTFRNSPKDVGKSEKTGTQPETATAGHSVRAGAVRAGGGAQAFKAAPELTGTLPDAAVIGRTVAGTIRAGSNTQAFKVTPELTGTLPEPSAKGHTITGALSAGANAESFKISPELTGTLPEEAHHGERED